MKRTLTFLMALVLLLGLALPAFAADVPTLTLSTDKASLAPGQTVTVTLTLDQALSGLNNYQFNVLYDASRFELTGSTVGAAPTVVSVPRKDERSGGDCITVSGLSTEGQAVALAAGTVATLTFKALEASTLGETEFTVTTQALPGYEAPTQAVELTVVNDANITIGEASDIVLGDVTGDGKVNLADASRVYQYARKKTTLSEDALKAADVTGDGKVNLADASRIYQYARKKINTF